MVSESQKRASQKYITEKTDEVKVRVPKGQKQKYAEKAKQNGESLNAIINRLLEKWYQMEREDKNNASNNN